MRDYLRRHLASEGIVTLAVTLSRCVCLCVGPPSLYHVSTARCIILLCLFMICEIALLTALEIF